MKIGTLCYATDQGLGILARAFYDHGVVTDVLVVRHGRRPTHDEWYPKAHQVSSLYRDLDVSLMRDFCASMDVMLFFETPFYWPLIEFCRDVEVKVVLMPMHECMPALLPAQPDLFLCPSLLDYDAYPHAPEVKRNSYFLPVPVEIPWRQRTKAEVFVHNAGHGGLKGRNGTAELLAAWEYVESAAQLLVRTQGNCNDMMNLVKSTRNVSFTYATVPYNELFSEGDVFVFPEKFNGLSLPLQEARAAGMLVMGTDRYPINTWLPAAPMISPVGFRSSRIGPAYREFSEAVLDPREIALKIDEWYGRDISDYSLAGKAWAEKNSWQALKPKYMKALEELVA